MRRCLGQLAAWVVSASTAIAQPSQTTELAAPVLHAPDAGTQPVVDCSCLETPSCAHFYAELDYLLRWFKPVCASVPIVTIGNPSAPVPGALGQPGTQVVIGGSPPHKFEFPMTSGMQVTLGWDRGDGAVGLEVSGFVMAQAGNSQHFTADANGFPNTYLPYQAPDGTFQALPFTIPGAVTGNSTAIGSTKIWGVESDLFVPFSIDRGKHVFSGRFLFGGRYLDLTDRVRITNSLRRVDDPSAFAVGADQFSTHNRFAGPQVGTTVGVERGRWSAELTTKFAAGITHQLRNIEGAPLLISSVRSPDLVPGPLLALPSNIGRETAPRVTLVPEIAIKTQVDLNSWCSLSLGYSLLYWNKVLCPGDQMSGVINITQVLFQGPFTGSPDPKPQFVHTDYFMQGLDFGIQFRY